MSSIAICLLSFCGLALLVHVITASWVGLRLRRAMVSSVEAGDWPAVSIIRPVAGLDAVETRTLESTFRLHAKNVEIIFCVARMDDPAVPFLQHLAANYPDRRARILIGDDLGFPNPKLNNIVKGWAAATNDWVIITDSNVLLPTDYVERLLGTWTDDIGLVCAPPIGDEPKGFWAEVECAFLNTYQGRWQYAADAAGFGFAQGKTMVWRRADLDAWGGISALGSEIAEDVVATKLVRSKGKRVCLSSVPFVQPIGRRTAAQVLRRQERWAQLRRLSFPHFFAPEILTGCVLPISAGAISLSLIGAPILLPVLGFVFCWLAAEAVLSWLAGWPLTWRSPIAWVVRDVCIPAIWARAWIARGYDWRGNSISIDATGQTQPRSPRAAFQS